MGGWVPAYRLVALMIASVCLLVGLALSVCLSTVARSWGRKQGELRSANMSQAGETVYVFEGVVFPAPHDPRWERVEAQDGSGADVFVFGDRDIRLSATTLSVGWGGGDDVRHAISGDPASRVLYYFDDVQRCYYYFRKMLALASVEPAIFNAGFAAERAKAVEPNTAGPYFDPNRRDFDRAAGQVNALAIPERREPRSIDEKQAMRAVEAVFRVDDDHVLPCPSADGWTHGDNDKIRSVYIHGGGHTLSVFEDGEAWLDACQWVQHPRVAELYRLVVALLPAKETLADKQRKAAEELLRR